MSGTNTPYYPLFMDISGKTCLVIGGGGVAERKVRILLGFNALIKVVSPKVTKSLSRLGERGRISILLREYEESDLDGSALVFAATNREEINARIKRDAGERKIPVNVVDNPRLCDFIVPSIVKRGPIVIAISTSGTLPSLSKKLRKVLAEEVTDDYIKYADILGRIRRLLIETEKSAEKRKTILKELGEMDVREVNRLGFSKIKDRYLNPHK